MITKELIAIAVCSIIQDVTIEDIMKERNIPGAKDDSVRFARQLCMTFARKYNLGTHAAIAEYYGKRDHATCMHSEKVINREIELYPEKATTYHRIEINLLELSLKSIKEQFQQQMDLELARFLRRAQDISGALLKDIELKERDIERLLIKNPV